MRYNSSIYVISKELAIINTIHTPYFLSAFLQGLLQVPLQRLFSGNLERLCWSPRQSQADSPIQDLLVILPCCSSYSSAAWRSLLPYVSEERKQKACDLHDSHNPHFL